MRRSQKERNHWEDGGKNALGHHRVLHHLSTILTQTLPSSSSSLFHFPPSILTLHVNIRKIHKFPEMGSGH